MNPLISVIMSVHNGKPHLQQSIESILNQTFTDFEFIIINDGSTDGSWNCISEYAKKDKRIVPLTHENIGLTRSLNKGMELARGEYIVRQDADDVSHPTRIKKQYDFMKANNQVIVCFSWTKIIDEFGSKIGEIHFSVKSDKIKNSLRKGRNIYVHGSSIFRKKEIQDLGGYSPEFKNSQDFDLWLRILNNNMEVGAIDNILYNWRLNPNSITSMKKNEQSEYGRLALQRNVRMNKASSKKVINPILHQYHNIYFRAQARKKILNNTYELIQCRELTVKQLIKTIIAISPFNYKFLFQYF